MFREVESACERGCLGKSGVSKVLCIRQCVSPSCYRDLYQADLVRNHTLKKKNLIKPFKFSILLLSTIFSDLLYETNMLRGLHI